jgi:hypothetical protein
METSAITIKIKGIDAVNAFASKGLGGLNLQGGTWCPTAIKIKGAAGSPGATIKVKGTALYPGTAKLSGAGGAKLASTKGIVLKTVEYDGPGLVMTKSGLVIKATEVEATGPCLAMQAASGKSAAAASGVTAAKGAAVATGVTAAKGAATAKTVGAASKAATGAAWCGKSAGWTMGLGGFGPLIVIGVLGLAATGAYLYLRNKKLGDAEELDELGSLSPA